MRLLPGLMMNLGVAATCRGRCENKPCYFNGLCRSEPAKQQQDEQHDQNDADQPHSRMAVAVAVAAEPAAEAAQQENNQDDDKYRSKRHGTFPNRRSANGNPPPRHPEQSITPGLVPCADPQTSLRAGKKPPQGVRGWPGRTFRKKMPTLERKSSDVVGPSAPQRDRPLGVPVVERTLRAPYHQNRRLDFARRGAVCAVMRAIDISGGAVFLANRVRVPRVAQCLDISPANFWWKRLGRRTPIAQRIVDDGLGRGHKDIFGKRLGLRQQRPTAKNPRGTLIAAPPPH